jgi:hypothetical protein
MPMRGGVGTVIYSKDLHIPASCSSTFITRQAVILYAEFQDDVTL